MSAEENNWRTPQFRQNVVAKIDEALQRSGMATAKKGTEMESHVFQKAKTKEEYLGFVARLILHVREINTKKAGGAMPGTGGVQDPINALQNLARQGTGNTMLGGGLPPPPGAQQPTPSNPLMQGMNPRPVLQQKLTTGMQNRYKNIDKTTANSLNEKNGDVKPEVNTERDPIEDELGEVDLVAAVNQKKRTFSEMCRDACSLLRAVNKKLDARDEFQVFGEHVAMKLRSLNSDLSKNVAQYHINNILFEALTGNYDNVPNNGNVQQKLSVPDQQHCSPAPSGQTMNSYMSPQSSISSHNSQNSTPFNNSPIRNSQPSSSSGSFSSTVSDIYNLGYDDFIQ